MRTGALALAMVVVVAVDAGRLRLPPFDDDPPPPTDCSDRPEICDLNEYCRLEVSPDNVNDVVGTCVASTPSTDCYRYPGVCPADEWCQLEDRDSWTSDENVTRGRCVSYQNLCSSCTRTAAEASPAMGLPLEQVLLGQLDVVTPSRTHLPMEDMNPEMGRYPERQTLCNHKQGLACTGDLIPTLPATCVQARNTSVPGFTMDLTPDVLLDWGQRWLRMGARTTFDRKTGAGLDSQLPQGMSRESLHRAVNLIFETLWPTVFGAWPGTMTVVNEGPMAPLCCQWDNYTETLTSFQTDHQGASWRNPVHPSDPLTGNAPACVWCEWDGAFNDENPVIWQTIHALTFNLPDVVSEAQYAVLRTLPAFLRQHLSCSLCRSHIGEHLIDLGVPTSRNGIDWAFYFWRAHNFVNEQSEVTRCGSMDCQWGSWSSPAPDFLCAGVYRYPWFMSWKDANKIWKKSWQSAEAGTRLVNGSAASN